jgi:uncharacterized membrane protein HdeD (DUF308 family)
MTKIQTFSSSIGQRLGPRWKILMLEGVCAIIFGIFAIVWPGLTFFVFLYIFGIFAVIEGLVLAISALYLRKTPMAWENETTPAAPGSWIILFVQGLLSIVAGFICLFLPRARFRKLDPSATLREVLDDLSCAGLFLPSRKGSSVEDTAIEDTAIMKK